MYKNEDDCEKTFTLKAITLMKIASSYGKNKMDINIQL